MSFDVLFEITNNARAIDSRGIYLGKRRAPSVSPTVRPTAKQPPCLYTRHQFQHCMPLRYVGENRWIVHADAICPRAQSMQRSMDGLQIPLVGVGSERRVILVHRDKESSSPTIFYVTSRIMPFLGRRIILLL